MANAKKDDGGPAFPGEREDPKIRMSNGDNLRHPVPGMTMRDWFAGQALAGLMADGEVEKLENWGQKVGIIAYELADAMLAERRREENNDVGDR